MQSDLARSLEDIAKNGARSFYMGETAQEIVAAVNSAGGHMTRADMEDYRALERVAVHGTYRGYDIIAMPPPSSGGIALIELLNILEGYPLDKADPQAPETLHLMAEAMKPVYADRATYLGDPDRIKIPVSGLISKALCSAIARRNLARQGARPPPTSSPAIRCLTKTRRRRISRLSMARAMRSRTLIR